jgi:hypothetical protein
MLANVSGECVTFQQNVKVGLWVASGMHTYSRVPVELFRGGKPVRDVNLVLRSKRVQWAELALEIDGLGAAASPLRPVVHLLSAVRG